MLNHTSNGLFINGEWVRPYSEETAPAINPATEEKIGTIQLAGTADMDRAVGAARTAFDFGPWPRLAPRERADYLRRIADAMESSADELATDLTTEMGSTITQSRLAQIRIAVDLWRYYAEMADTYPWLEERSAYDRPNQGNRILVRKEAAGVVVGILPWNGPHITAAMKAAPALLAGCTVVLKPSPEAALIMDTFGDIVMAAGLPNGVLNIVSAERTASEYLVTAKGVDRVSFTGSVAAGRRVASLCGERLIGCTTELGGKSAAILLDDVDLSLAVPNLAVAMAFINGQACTAPTRILIPKSRAREAREAIVEHVRALPLGLPEKEETFIGPLVSTVQRDRVEGYIGIGRDEGARILLGGQRPAQQDRGYFVEPTIFADVHNGMRVAREEIFGPVYALIEYDGDQEAIAIANDSDYGLSGSVWSQDVERAIHVSAQIQSGSVHVNNHGADCAAPQGGYKISGIGRERGPEGVDDFTLVKSTIVPNRY
ncbi:aldehyde dehydrogenase family protein [Pseudarthrobacter sp. AG30]|uniref:aldehyde dehydrogenase n=1 Tax=Pseudarthrobacter sp. AG30 TaxID=2249742 RepID=UPI000D6E6D76|nr:aldehyde dehydrogenase [Pseudarthrobacter sp. AG30]RAX15119.1 aldehyde dehydrogenase family protein [Pseudarthrobacter sp. AG30]